MLTQFRKVFLSAIALCFASSSAALEIQGAGSSAAQPLYVKWAEHYSSKSKVKLQYQPVGSSAGIKQIKQKMVDFGASDVALSAEEIKKENLICFPSAISGVVPVINVPGIKSGELKLTGEILADIFAGKIKKWNAPEIAALNPQVKLPKIDIETIVRQEGSGTTYNFTDYLSKVSKSWKDSFGRNFLVKWPSDAKTAKGSSGVVATLKETPGSITYVDYNYVTQNELAYVMLRNRHGKFVAPTPDAFAAALDNSGWRTTTSFDEMLTDKPGPSSWPITMGTFVILPQTARDPARMAATLEFFTWAFMNGDRVVSEIDFVRLPDMVQAKIYAEMARITDSKGNMLKWKM